MAVKVQIPRPLQRLTGNQAEVSLEIGEVIKVIDFITKLDEVYGGIKERLVKEEGKIGRFINVYVNEEDIRFLDRENTEVKDGDEISIVPAIAGG